MWAWDEWNGKLVGPQARVHSYALARFLFLCFRWARRRRVRRRMSGCLCFHISGRPRMQGLVELGRLTCIYLRPWGGAGALFLFSFIDLLGLGSALDIG